MRSRSHAKEQEGIVQNGSESIGSTLFQISGLASSLFRRSSEGLIFIRPSPWVLGRASAYQVTESQAEHIARRVSRAYIVCMVGGLTLVLGAALLIEVPAVMTQHPVCWWIGVALFAILLVASLTFAINCAAGPVLADIKAASTPPPPQSYNPFENLKKTNAVMIGFVGVFPTWAISLFLLLGSIGVLRFIMEVLNAPTLASSEGIMKILSAGMGAWMLYVTAIVLIKRLAPKPRT
jgi:hypothetical protein